MPDDRFPDPPAADAPVEDAAGAGRPGGAPVEDPAGAGRPGGAPVGDADDLEVLRSRRRRRTSRFTRLLAALLAVALLLPAGRWALDELRFRRAGDAVVATLDGERAAHELAETVLLVRTVACGTGAPRSGSAFVAAGADGPVVVTNRHVVEGARQVGLRTLDGGETFRVADVRVSDAADVAVLEVAEAGDLPPALAVRGGPPERGADVRLVGFPAATPFTTAGTVRDVSTERLLLDLEVHPGASGSPVVGEDGRVVGQVFAVTADGLGVATPSDRLLDAMAQARPADPC